LQHTSPQWAAKLRPARTECYHNREMPRTKSLANSAHRRILSDPADVIACCMDPRVASRFIHLAGRIRLYCLAFQGPRRAHRLKGGFWFRLPREAIDIRLFDSGSLGHLLDAEAQAWNLDLRWDYSSSRSLIAGCLDEKRIAGYVIKDHTGVSGYSFFFYEEGKGLIGSLFVEGPQERVERAQFLLRHVLETLLATPGITRIETQLPHFSFESLEPLFTAHAHEGFRRRFMLLSLARSRWSPYGPGVSQANHGALRNYRILPWERRHDTAVAQVIYSAYRDHIDSEINDQYGTLTGAGRLVESILKQRGCGEMLPKTSRVAVHLPSGKLAAALAVTAVRPRTAHIPQIAVAPEFQNQGLGSALLETAFQDLIQNRFEEVSLTVTDRNAGAVRLYEHLGFYTLRTFGAYTWNEK